MTGILKAEHFALILTALILLLLIQKPASKPELYASINKQRFKSSEKLQLNLKLYSALPTNVSLEVFGIRDRFGRYKIRDNRRLSVYGSREMNLSYTLLSCFGCSGIRPGNYSLHIRLVYDNKTAERKFEIRIER